MTTKHNLFVAIVLVGFILQASAKRIYVKQSGSSAAEGQRVKDIASNIGSIVHEFPEFGGASIEVPDDLDITSLRGDPRFAHVEEVPQGHALVVPNDPSWSNQWGPKSLLMDQVWNLIPWNQTRLKNITIAVCDSGIALDHEDLDTSHIIWRYNYVSGNTNITDDHFHGTHVSGIAAATTNNAVGVAGIAYGVNLMVGKVLDSTGYGYYDDWMKCITDTTNAGANIINLSFGGLTNSSDLEDAVNYAVQKGVLVVVAAGNTYQSNNNAPHYPGAFVNSFTVANLQQDGTRSPSSTTNSFVDISAPGTAIYNTVPLFKGSYSYLTGTSMATPCIAAISALLMSAKPGVTADDIRNLLQNTATDIGTPGKDNEYGYGRVNPLKAAKVLLNQPPVISVGTSYDLTVNQTLSLNVSCSSVESFDVCVSLNVTNVPAFMTVTELSGTELMIEATPTVADGSSNQVTFTAVDTFDTVTRVTVTFAVPDASGRFPNSPSTKTPGSATVSSASQLSCLGMALLLANIILG